VRAVLDPNVLISALLPPTGAPAQIVSRWLAGEFELVVSGQVLAELERAFGYPKLSRRIPPADADEFVELLRGAAVVASDPPPGTHSSADPGDDYLLGLAEAAHAMLVSGDQHLLGLADRLPIQTANEFLEMLAHGDSDPAL
jgi:putative PIN family toxin of toxin-antitoxin system